jgi:hypothetical protein
MSLALVMYAQTVPRHWASQQSSARSFALLGWLPRSRKFWKDPHHTHRVLSLEDSVTGVSNPLTRGKLPTLTLDELRYMFTDGSDALRVTVRSNVSSARFEDCLSSLNRVIGKERRHHFSILGIHQLGVLDQ